MDNKQNLNENKLIEQVLANIRKRETPAITYMHIRRLRRVVVSFATTSRQMFRHSSVTRTDDVSVKCLREFRFLVLF